MLSIQGITRQYTGTDTPAVREVSLEVPQGEILALVGESGSGKTTLLRLVAGLEYPDAGKIEIDGQQVADGGGKVWVPPHKRKVGLVFQDGALFPHLTAWKNVAYGLSPKEFTKEEKAKVVGSLLEMTNLGHYADRFPYQLSGGERQRLAVARALAPRPKILLLDEPFSNLDPSLRRHIREDILDILRKSDITAIMVTHDTDDALAIGDRVAVFKDGKIEQSGTPAEIYHNPRSGYCARLFGAANEVCRDGEAPKWIRPEHMELAKEKSEGCIPVKILGFRNTGKELEARLECLDSSFYTGGEHWAAYTQSDKGMEVGSEAWVRLEAKYQT